MAVRLEFIDVLVPVHVIEEKYPGGFGQCLADLGPLVGRRVWHDGALLRDGALDPDGARTVVEGWQALGIEPLQWIDRRLHWHELCVVDVVAGGPTVGCEWLEWDPAQRIAWLRGGPRGGIVGRVWTPVPAGVGTPEAARAGACGLPVVLDESLSHG